MSEGQSLTQKAYEKIKEKIVKCEYMPEKDISEDELIRENGISRTPIREALLRLEQEKLIRIIPRKAIFVSDISLNTINEVFEARAFVEPRILRLIGANISRDWLQKMRRRFLEKPKEEDELWYHINLDKEFHSYLFDSFGNSYLIQLMNTVFDQNQRLRILSFKTTTNRFASSDTEHIEIIDKLLAGDIDGAEECMKRHIQNSKSVALNINTRYSDFEKQTL